MSTKTRVAVFGGGCFWCTEAVFQELKGVASVTPGYAGGDVTRAPTYEEVCSGKTGHAEVIRVEFDPAEISYKDLLTVFFATHNPTTRNRQGNDVGTQYRSVILYTSEKQKREAETFVRELNDSSAYGEDVITEIAPLTEFFEAEDYHKNYYRQNKTAPYCEVVINPKLEKIHERFGGLVRKKKDE